MVKVLGEIMKGLGRIPWRGQQRYPQRMRLVESMKSTRIGGSIWPPQLFLIVVTTITLITPATAVFLNVSSSANASSLGVFSSCLPTDLQKNNNSVHFTPLNVSAVFGPSPDYGLNVTAYGSVVGGAIINDSPEATQNLATTFYADYNFVTYTPWYSGPQNFCHNATLSNNASRCPIEPIGPEVNGTLHHAWYVRL